MTTNAAGRPITRPAEHIAAPTRKDAAPPTPPPRPTRPTRPAAGTTTPAAPADCWYNDPADPADHWYNDPADPADPADRPTGRPLLQPAALRTPPTASTASRWDPIGC